MTETKPIGIQNRFSIAIAFVLAHETEYNKDGSVKTERDPADPGGATRFGVDQRSHPDVDVASLTLDQAKDIYFNGEWKDCRCSELKPPWDLAVFDAAVNVGSSRAIHWAQTAAGTNSDGFIGPKTIAAINASGPTEFNDFIELRKDYYKTKVRASLRNRYLKGWLARVSDLETLAAEGDGTRLMA